VLALVLQLLNDALTFAGAMLLNLLVQHLEQATAVAPAPAAVGSNLSSSRSSHLVGISQLAGDSGGSSSWLLPHWVPGPGDPYWGFVLAGLLGLSALAKAVIGSHYSYGLSMVTVR
jgi:hypothetical protein